MLQIFVFIVSKRFWHGANTHIVQWVEALAIAVVLPALLYGRVEYQGDCREKGETPTDDNHSRPPWIIIMRPPWIIISRPPWIIIMRPPGIIIWRPPDSQKSCCLPCVWAGHLCLWSETWKSKGLLIAYSRSNISPANKIVTSSLPFKTCIFTTRT